MSLDLTENLDEVGVDTLQLAALGDDETEEIPFPCCVGNKNNNATKGIMKILCLILASDTAPEYKEFQSLWRRYMKQNRFVDCFFYKGDPDLSEPVALKGDTLWIRIEEDWTTVYEKTLRAFEFFLPVLPKYDFVYRTNLSTFTAFPELLDYCSGLPKVDCCAAVTGGIPETAEDRDSLKYPYSFPGGCGFILSPNLVHRIVQEKEPLDHQDDVTIGNALRRWGIRIQEFVRPDFCNTGMWYVNNIHLLQAHEANIAPKRIMFSYRFKSVDRNKDILMMDRFIRKYYAA